VSAERDVHEISALIDAFGHALHAQDLERSMAPLATEADLAVIPSEGVDVYRGPDAVRAFLSRIYESSRRYGWSWNDRWISVEGTTAWFVAAGDEEVDEEDATHTIPYCLTGVAVRTPSGWRLRLLHASEDPHPSMTRTS
jgi:hypothetical protein